MTAVTVTIDAPRSEVWEALVDVRTYPTWLVGARRIRHVDHGWPVPGTAFHHVVGLGPVLTIKDRTSSVAVDPERRLELEVRARPLVRATVVFELRDVPDGTEVTLEEHPIGAHRLLAPLVAPLTQARNRASLAQLEDRVHERSGSGQTR
jgi:uncharacterized protein YndB with AHSA1/START domain